MDDDRPEVYCLASLITGQLSEFITMRSGEAYNRNEWLLKFGSPNLRWLTPQEMNKLEEEMAKRGRKIGL